MYVRVYMDAAMLLHGARDIGAGSTGGFQVLVTRCFFFLSFCSQYSVICVLHSSGLRGPRRRQPEPPATNLAFTHRSLLFFSGFIIALTLRVESAARNYVVLKSNSFSFLKTLLFLFEYFWWMLYIIQRRKMSSSPSRGPAIATVRPKSISLLLYKCMWSNFRLHE